MPRSRNGRAEAVLVVLTAVEKPPVLTFFRRHGREERVQLGAASLAKLKQLYRGTRIRKVAEASCLCVSGLERLSMSGRRPSATRHIVSVNSSAPVRHKHAPPSCHVSGVEDFADPRDKQLRFKGFLKQRNSRHGHCVKGERPIGITGHHKYPGIRTCGF